MILMAPPGYGKTSLAAQWPEPEFIVHPRDRSVITLMNNKLLLPRPVQLTKDWIGTVLAVERAASSSSKTVVLESLQYIEDQAFRHCCAIDFQNNFTDQQGWLNYAAGERTTARKYWPHLLDAIDMVLAAGKHFIMTGHTYLKGTKNPRGNDYEADSPVVSSPIWNVTTPIIQCICHIGMVVELQEVKKQKPETKLKVADDRKVLVMYPTATYKGAKNKWGIQTDIECGASAETTYVNLANAAKFNVKTGFHL